MAEASWRTDAPQPAALARFLAERGQKVDEAVRLAESAAAERRDIFTEDALAWSYFKAGRLSEAASAMARAQRTGSRDRAIREFEAALKLKPDDHTAAYQLAMIYRQTGNLERAGKLMAIAQKAASVPEAGVARRQELVKIIRQVSQ